MVEFGNICVCIMICSMMGCKNSYKINMYRTHMTWRSFNIIFFGVLVFNYNTLTEVRHGFAAYQYRVAAVNVSNLRFLLF